MKKIFMLLTFAMVCQLSFGQSYQNIIDELKDKEGVQYQELDKSLLSMAAAAASDESVSALMKRLDCLNMLQFTLDDLDDDDATAFVSIIKEMGTRYNKMAEEVTDEEVNYVFYDGEDPENIDALIVIQMTQPESGIGMIGMMIVLEGKLKQSYLEQISQLQ